MYGRGVNDDDHVYKDDDDDFVDNEDDDYDDKDNDDEMMMRMRIYLQPKSSTRGLLICHTPQMVYMPAANDNEDTDSGKNDDDSNHNESDVNDDKTLKT